MDAIKRFPLQTKFFLAFALVALVPLIAYSALVYQSITSALTQVEDSVITERLASVKRARDFLNDGLMQTVTDYTVWEEAYTAMTNLDAEWFAWNITDWIPEHFGMDLVLATDRGGRLRFRAGGFSEYPDGADLGEWSVVRRALAEEQSSGIISTKKGLVYFAAAPFLHDDGSGPPVGVLVCGKLMDSEYVKLIKDLMGAEVAIFQDTTVIAATDAELAKLIPSTVLTRVREGKDYIDRPNPYVVAIYSPLRDVEGQVVGFIQVALPRYTINIAQAKIRNTLAILLVIGLMWVLALGRLFHHLIVEPIHQLAASTQRIAAGDLSPVVPVITPDEIGELATNLNQMTKALRKSFANLTTLLEMSQVVSSTLNLDELLSQVLEKIAKTMGVSYGYIALLDETSESQKEGTAEYLVVKALYQEEGDRPALLGQRLPWKTFASVQRAFEARKPQGIAGVNAPSLSQAEREHLRKIGAKAVVQIPLISHDCLIGLIVLVEMQKERGFSPEEVDLCQTMANQAAMAIENARLFSDLESNLQELKRAQAQLIQAEKLAAIGQLMAGVTHELNNPLTSIMGYCQLLQATECSEEIKEDLQRIYRQALRCQKIVEGLLTFARKHEPEKEYVNINDVVESTLALQAPLLEADNIEVIKDLDRELPLTMADPHQIQQVFVNIINNAHEAMVTAKGGGRLTVRSARDGDTIRVQFMDNGPGIPPEIMNRIFEPFFTTKEPGKGTGLGLSIAYGIVQTHGGHIWAESVVGEGATFIIELPVRGLSKDLDYGGRRGE